jgi:UDP-glucuronate 4-epimerase
MAGHRAASPGLTTTNAQPRAAPVSTLPSASLPPPHADGAVLVTGCAGFIGSHVAAALLRRGTPVVGIDNFDPFYARSIKERNLDRVRNALSGDQRRFTLIEGDLCDSSVVRSLFAGRAIASVIHLAAKAGVRPSVEDPPAYANANVLATSLLLHHAAIAGVKRCVVASSSSVYGNGATVPFHEGLDVGEPISPYAATKRACELLGYTHWHLTKMPTAMLRFFTVFGPGQRPDLAINLFMRKALKHEPITLYGSLDSSRDYTFIDDIVIGVLSAMDRIDRFGYRVWNLGGAAPVTLGELVSAIGTVTGSALNVSQGPSRPGDVDRTFASLDRARAELDFAPSVPLLEGLEAQWEWMKAQG